MTWRDQSGNGNDLTARAGAEPTYEPTAVYLDPVDHDAIERQLDEQMGIKPKQPKWKPVGPPVACDHGGRLEKRAAAKVGGAEGVSITHWRCACGHGWIEVSS